MSSSRTTSSNKGRNRRTKRSSTSAVPRTRTNIQITNNTIINDLHSSGAVAVLKPLTIPVTLTGNDVYGLTSSQITKGPASVSGTTLLTSEPPLATTHPWQVGTAPPDQLVAYLSESIAPGNAQFIVSVDGKQLGAAQTVTASQPAGQAETFSFSGSFGPGSHTIAIDFSGDTGTAAQNLFVGGLDYDGQHYAADTATLSKGGVSTFSVFPSNVICYAAGTTSSPLQANGPWKACCEGTLSLRSSAEN